MAKKKINPKDIKGTWRYKNKNKSHKAKVHNEWLECNYLEKAKLESKYPNQFVYEAITAPEPTPSMEKVTNKEEK